MKVSELFNKTLTNDEKIYLQIWLKKNCKAVLHGGLPVKGFQVVLKEFKKFGPKNKNVIFLKQLYLDRLREMQTHAIIEDIRPLLKESETFFNVNRISFI